MQYGMGVIERTGLNFKSHLGGIVTVVILRKNLILNRVKQSYYKSFSCKTMAPHLDILY